MPASMFVDPLPAMFLIAFLNCCLFSSVFLKKGVKIVALLSKLISEILSSSFKILSKYLSDFLTSYAFDPPIEPLSSITHTKSIGILSRCP